MLLLSSIVIMYYELCSHAAGTTAVIGTCLTLRRRKCLFLFCVSMFSLVTTRLSKLKPISAL